jgi:hypothetical protein
MRSWQETITGWLVHFWLRYSIRGNQTNKDATVEQGRCRAPFSVASETGLHEARGLVRSMRSDEPVSLWTRCEIA